MKCPLSMVDNASPKNAFRSFVPSQTKVRTKFLAPDLNVLLSGSIVPKSWARDCPGTETRALTGILQCAPRGLHQLEALGLGLRD